AMAARTKRIRLITGAVIPAFHHPAHLGGELAMLDNMSRGRLDAGFGRAFLPKEFEVYGVPMSESRDRFEEAIGIIRRLWTEDRVTANGKFWRFEDVRLMPRPYQKPHPPIWIAAISSEESFTYAAKNGFNLMIVPYAGKPGQLQEFVKMYRRLWKEAGHKRAEQIQVAQFCYVAEKSVEAMAGFRRICKRYLETFADAVQSWQGTSSDQYPGYDKMVASILATTPEKIIEQGGAFVGAPDEVVEQVKRCRDQFGGDIEPSMQINFGGSSDAESFRTVELIAAKVMPRFS
ncbi:MAG TPA: LLM class flavin-dependent oxidoreductase, partial [Burkholderiales bacterium]|nr:LLM class flavin-dependent oxidoreductase [Burkholderiales bacterium]